MVLRDLALGKRILAKVNKNQVKVFCPSGAPEPPSWGVTVDVILDPSERRQLWGSELLPENQVQE